QVQPRDGRRPMGDAVRMLRRQRQRHLHRPRQLVVNGVAGPDHEVLTPAAATASWRAARAACSSASASSSALARCCTLSYAARAFSTLALACSTRVNGLGFGPFFLPVGWVSSTSVTTFSSTGSVVFLRAAMM